MFAVAVLAIYGDWIRHKLTPPVLRLELRSQTTFFEVIGGKKHRYIHLELGNSGWIRAENPIVYLTKIEQHSDGGWNAIYRTGKVPLKWQFYDCGAGNPPIGPNRIWDLACLIEGDGLKLSTRFAVAGLEYLHGNQRLRINLTAEADHARARSLVVELWWDGTWHDENDEMAKHLSLSSATCHA
jgi:hypothetical protein